MFFPHPHLGRAFVNIDRDYRAHNAFRGRSSIGGKKQGRPRSFTPYRDPRGRFILEYPADWKLRRKDGVQVSSPTLGSFARVDLIPDEPQFWKHLAEGLRRAGGKVELKSRSGSKPVHVKGTIEAGRTRFDWDAYAWTVGKLRVVLSLGNVVDSRRSAAIERYEDGVLAAIRRHFLVRSG